jgi:ribosomal-protein-alanine N-acetyltransferase
MSAVLKDDAADVPSLARMREQELDEVMAIENVIYTHPWTRGNFVDSLRAGYQCCVLRSGAELIGYFVLMVAAGEAHLLNLSIAREEYRGFAAVIHISTGEYTRVLTVIREQLK